MSHKKEISGVRSYASMSQEKTDEIVSSLRNILKDLYGTRCREFCFSCVACRMWAFYDELRTVTKS